MSLTVKKFLALPCLLLISLLAGCFFESDEPIIPRDSVVFPLGKVSIASAYAQNPDDPAKWEEHAIGALLNQRGIEAEFAKPKYAALREWWDENSSEEFPFDSHPELKKLMYSVPVRWSQDGYMFGDSSVVFADLAGSGIYLIQVQVRREDGSDYYVFAQGMLRGKRLYVSTPDATDLPKFLYDDFGCGSDGFADHECKNLTSYDDYVRALSSSEHSYNLYLELE